MNTESASAQRGRILLEQGRFAEAEKYFREALAIEPNDGETLYYLAFCLLQQKRLPEARDTVRAAIALDPENSAFHVLHAMVLARLDKLKEAQAAVQAALEIEPESDQALYVRATLHASRMEWAKAEKDARAALEINPENGPAANLLAHSLRLQNRPAESADQVAYMLSQDPEDADTQSTAGWTALQRGDREAAEKHFLEALRLEPHHEIAREGLKEAFKARSPVYRMYLNYCFFMQRFTAKMQWALIIGLLVGVRLVRAIFPPPIALAVLAAYFLFVLWVHVARAVGNFQLTLDRFARHALTRAETWEAWVVGGGVVVGVPFVIIGVLANLAPVLVVGVTLIGLAFPLAYVFTNRSIPGRILFGVAAAIVLLAGVASLFPSLLGSDAAASLTGLAVLAVVAVTWLCNIPALRRRV